MLLTENFVIIFFIKIYKIKLLQPFYSMNTA